MKLYGGMDLHSNNSYVVIQDEQDQVVYRKRLPNVMSRVVAELRPYQGELVGVVVESTYNWYWLVDGLMEEGYRVHLANTSAIQQYNGLKYSDDGTDARWLRDLLRQRSWLVRQHTSHVLHVGNIITRNRGERVGGRQIQGMTGEEVRRIFPDRERALAVESSLAVMGVLEDKIGTIEQQVKKRVKGNRLYRLLETVYGIGEILAWTIGLETGEVGRFAQVGDYVSYCRCVDSRRLSNDKKKGENNRRNGNKYLAWAYVEAAHYAARFYRQPRRFVERKTAEKNQALALKALAHKLARACYYVLRDEVEFEPVRLFGT